jgi:hypothetical protein
MIKKWATLEDLEKSSKGPVYVINATSGELAAKVLFNVPKVNGNGSDLIRVPRSFAPIDLAMQVPRNQLLQAAEFRQTLMKGLLRICNPEYAKMILNSEDGKEEARRVQNEMNAARQVVENAVLQDETEDDYVEVKDVAKNVKKAKEEGGDDTVNIKLKTLVNTAIHDEYSQPKVVGSLRNYGALTKKEVSFVNKKFKDSPRVRKYLREYAVSKGWLEG